MTPIEYAYYLAYSLHKFYGLSARRMLEGRTVSVGNITVGGTGKTPLVIAIAEEAKKRKLRTCVLTRGYRGKVKGPVIVSIGKGPLTSWEEAGDEPFLMSENVKGAWIIKDSNRYRGGLVAGGVDLFLLDDGYQHWRLQRDLDILVIDSTDPFGKGRLLPLGRLREPLSEMKRAGMILINKARERNMAIEDTIRKFNPAAPIFYSHYRIEGLIDTAGRCFPLNELRGRKIFAFSGIGSPQDFLTTLRGVSASPISSLSFKDHHHYSEQDLKRIIKKAEKVEAEIIITTEKDMVKIRDMEIIQEDKKFFALKISLEITDKKFYDIIFDGLPHEEQRT
jgi:tetraacyldisaccharide 4'-kinase